METDSDTSDFKKEICVLDQYQFHSGIGIILNIHCNPETESLLMYIALYSRLYLTYIHVAVACSQSDVRDM